MTRSRGPGRKAQRVTKEQLRLQEDQRREKNWKRWGPYLPERQWATVREDYSESGNAWGYFGHDQAPARAYRWGEDGLMGWCDRQCRLAFSFAFWNGRDPILKERFFGLTGPEGNHGEDVKECYFYLEATPTHSYNRCLYKYPQSQFPYRRLREENARRDRFQPEYELLDTGIFEDSSYFDLFIEYAKAGPDDTLIQLTICNRADHRAELAVLPTLWFRNTWSWGRHGEDYLDDPPLLARRGQLLRAEHPTLGAFELAAAEQTEEWLFTENLTNRERLYGAPNPSPYVKDAFHRYLVEGRTEAVNPDGRGTKAALLYRLQLGPGEERRLRFRLNSEAERPRTRFGRSFDQTMARRRKESEEFYADLDPGMPPEDRNIWRQAYAGLLFSKQFYHYAVGPWLAGDPNQPPPPASRHKIRNKDWSSHLYNRDLILMPDTWEYPWYAAWDLAFHALPLARLDPAFAKDQLLLMLREWYMHPNGQIPAYEWNFSDVNPPVHAWACLATYRLTGAQDRVFLERAFHKLLLNFTWWVNRTDADGNNVFSGGFLGLDNIGVFDRSKFPPHLGELEQADATGWMAFFCLRMLDMALELSHHNPAYEDIASKFFEHFVAITHSLNHVDGHGLWDEQDGFYYDSISNEGGRYPLRVRSMVGLLPLIAVEIMDLEDLAHLTGFRRRLDWFLTHRPHLASHVIQEQGGRILLSAAPVERLRRVLQKMLDEDEFLSDFGIRSLSRHHSRHPFELRVGRERYRVDYEPAESVSGMFGGNSNWRGPVWFPVNYLLVDALKTYHQFFGAELKVDYPTGVDDSLTLLEVAYNLEHRLANLFRPGPQGRPAHGGRALFRDDPHWRELIWFYEYFHAENGAGLGASHQTGWTALIAKSMEDMDRSCCRPVRQGVASS